MRKRILFAALALMLPMGWFVLNAPAQQIEPAKKTDTRKLAEIAPKAAPVAQPDPKKIQESLRKGIDFLVKDQNKNGSWGSPELKGGVASVTESTQTG